MAETRKSSFRRRNNLPKTSPLFRRGSDSPSLAPGRAALASFLSWPEPDCPGFLKPVLLLASALVWLALAALAVSYGPSAGFWPVLPAAAVFLTAAFVGGSRLAVIVAALFALGLHFGLLNLELPDLAGEMSAGGPRFRDLVLFLTFVGLCGFPRWRRKFSWPLTLLWGMVVVFAPMIFILVSFEGFYGQPPETAAHRFLNRDFLFAWGLTVIAAALAARILYLIKDYLRRVEF